MNRHCSAPYAIAICLASVAACALAGAAIATYLYDRIINGRG